MKGIILGIIAFSISTQCISQQSFVEYFELKNMLPNSLKIADLTNLDPQTNIPRNAQKQTGVLFAPQKIKLDHVEPFLSFSAAWSEQNEDQNQSALLVRFSANGLDWDPWLPLHIENHYEGGRFTAVSTLMTLDKSISYYQLRCISNLKSDSTSIQAIRLNFFNPGSVKKNNTSPVLSSGLREKSSCACMKPKYVSRSGWNCPQGAWPVATTSPLTHLIVHHSAGQNNSPDWAATVLSIWNFHVASNGYSDIGYNWLIAPDGTLFEGRYSDGADALGAHFCSKNSNTMGVCMLGLYTDQTASPEALSTLTQLLAWKSCELNIEPRERAPHSSSGLDLLRISGHRDGCSTECPGEKLYQDLPKLRTTVSDLITSACLATDITLHQDRLQILLSPNPTTGWSELTLNPLPSFTLNYKIFNSQGQLIFKSDNILTRSPDPSYLLNLSGYPGGVYHLIIQAGPDIMHRKILKL
ncbi:MAG: N-acetylmuramoyl-L-alanine amidase [Saprospiraceae bacterium]